MTVENTNRFLLRVTVLEPKAARKSDGCNIFFDEIPALKKKKKFSDPADGVGHGFGWVTDSEGDVVRCFFFHNIL